VPWPGTDAGVARSLEFHGLTNLGRAWSASCCFSILFNRSSRLSPVSLTTSTPQAPLFFPMTCSKSPDERARVISEARRRAARSGYAMARFAHCCECRAPPPQAGRHRLCARTSAAMIVARWSDRTITSSAAFPAVRQLWIRRATGAAQGVATKGSSETGLSLGALASASARAKVPPRSTSARHTGGAKLQQCEHPWRKRGGLGARPKKSEDWELLSDA